MMLKTNPSGQQKINDLLAQLASRLKGELHWDEVMRKLYATDASAYREMPLGVALPKDHSDLKQLIDFAQTHQISLLPRAAGTSLAGQVVGKGLVVDISLSLNKILEINPEEKWVRVQPGVIRDELNHFLKPYGLMFGPETSTANRAMLGGMVGNNSCGSNSVVYGSTREHLLEVKAYLSDGSEVLFEALGTSEFQEKLKLENREGDIYRLLSRMLSQPENQQEIFEEFPKPSIPRRNTGYALDLLLQNKVFSPESHSDFNLCQLIAGSEGTLCLMSELKLSLVDLPPAQTGLLCCHFNSVDEALRANLIALEFQPTACELMDHFILECTKANARQRENRFFVQGEPGAILVVELKKENDAEIQAISQEIEKRMRAQNLGYHFPLVLGDKTKKVWELRKAGLGLLSNIPGDAKPAPVIEDTAVDVADLPAYIRDFNKILDQHQMSCVHYAHAGSGELHLRPIINLKTKEGNQQFRMIAEEIARLVKAYKGSLSGEHGDGRLRGEFLKYMIGEKNYELCRQVKNAFDPQGLFNPQKIIDTPSMNSNLRYEPGQETPDLATILDFSNYQGLLRAAEMCNGSGDCRKTEISGGTMCPSYMATRKEKDTTRARANILREVITQSRDPQPLASEAIKEVMDLCLSCKGCKSECPSNVDIGKMKAEFLQQYYDKKGVPLRTRLIAGFTRGNGLASLLPGVYNFMFKNEALARPLKKLMGFAPKRSMPLLHRQTLKAWFRRWQKQKARRNYHQKVYFFCDEFSNFNDVPQGQALIQLLDHLGYEVMIPKHLESGRTYLSKGLLRSAQKIARENVRLLKDIVQEGQPLIGLEPSAILTFRDEYPDLLRGKAQEEAKQLAQHCFTFEEFLAREVDRGRVKADQFSKEERLVKLHGHCHQKSLSSLTPSKKILTLPSNYQMHLIPSGCCGMAGSFGYEKEHYDISMKIGELVLFPTVRKQKEDVIIAAAGTSCRHQIKDGTGKKALHPAEILWEALIK